MTLETPTRTDHRPDGLVVDLPRPSRILLRVRTLSILAVVAGVFLALLAALTPDTLLHLDRPISELVRGYGRLVGIFRDLTELGSPTVLLVISMFVGAAVWQRCRAFAVALPAAVLVGMLADVTLKSLVSRERPTGSAVETAMASFPSGHVIAAVVFFGLIPPLVVLSGGSRVCFRVSVGVFLGVVTTVLVSRVYLGAHWPTDVLASLLIGASILLGAEYLLGRHALRRHCTGCPLHTATEPCA